MLHIRGVKFDLNSTGLLNILHSLIPSEHRFICVVSNIKLVYITYSYYDKFSIEFYTKCIISNNSAAKKCRYALHQTDSFDLYFQNINFQLKTMMVFGAKKESELVGLNPTKK